MTNQLGFWDEPEQAHDNRPLPLIVADKWGFSLAYVPQLTLKGEVYWYSVQDWLLGLGVASNAVRKEWSWLKKQLSNLAPQLNQLPYKAGNGKTYQMDFATDEALYRITQSLRPLESRGSGINEARNAIFEYLAKAGVLLDEMRLDPSLAIDAGVTAYKKQGKSDAWIKARLEGKLNRNLFTEALHDCVKGIEPRHYGQATNDVYTNLYNRTAAQLRSELGLSAHTSLRDAMPSMANAYTGITEQAIAHKLGAAKELSWAEADAIIIAIAKLISQQVHATSAMLGVDIATNKPLLHS